MAGKIHTIITQIIDEKSKQNPILGSIVRTKLILRGIVPANFNENSEDDPEILKKLEDLQDTELEETKKNLEVSKKWSSLLEDKVDEISSKSESYEKSFESMKKEVIETLKNKFEINLIIKEQED